jgi:DNA-binding beta-propeller fold protein YncE
MNIAFLNTLGHNRALFAVAIALASSAGLAQAPNYKLIHKFPIGGEGGWDYMADEPGSHHLFITRGSHVMVMDTETGKIVGDIPDTRGVHGVAIASRLGKGFTSNGAEGTVTVFDLGSLKVITKVSVGRGPDAIVYDPSTQRVFTMNGRSGDSTAVDAKSNTVAGTIKLDGRPEFAAVDGKGHVYVNIEDKSEIQEIDARNLKVLRTWPLAPGDGPSGLTIDARHGYLFSTCDNNFMAISGIAAGKVVATTPLANGPDAAAFDPGLGIAFGSCGEGKLTIIKESKGGFQTYNVATQPSARTMALDPRTHRVYLIAAEMSAPQPGERRGRMVPGSATILVLAPQ